MATRKSSSRTATGAKSAGKRVAGKQRAIQRQADADNARKSAQKAAKKQAAKSAGKSASKKKPVQAGTRRQPENPLPKQTQSKPGQEHALDPQPRFLAPDYVGSGKLDGMVALVTGGDSGIGRSVAVLFARAGKPLALATIFRDGESLAFEIELERAGRAPTWRIPMTE